MVFHPHTFYHIAIRQGKEILCSITASGYLFLYNSNSRYPETILQLQPESGGKVRHLMKILYPPAMNPLEELSAPERLLSQREGGFYHFLFSRTP